MNFLMNLYPGHQVVNYLVIIAVATALVSVAAWGVSLFLERFPAIRYRILFSALIAVLVSPILALVFSASGTSFVKIPLLVESRSSVSLTESHSHQTLPADRSLTKAILNEFPVSNDELTATQKITVANEARSSKAPESSNDSATVDPSKVAKVAVTVPEQKNVPINVFQLIVVAILLVWLCGAIVSLASVLRSSLFLRRLCRSMQESSNVDLENTFNEAKRLIKAKITSKVMVSALVRTPLATGVFRPVIVLPIELPSAINRDQLCDVLVHELAHIERRDNLVVLLQLIARTLFWPIVSIHLLNRQLAKAREEVCDNYVLARRDAMNYGETLLQLAQLACGVKVPMGTVGILHWRGKLEDRIFGLIHNKRSKITRSSFVTSIAILSLFLLISAFLCNASILSARADEKNKGFDIEKLKDLHIEVFKMPSSDNKEAVTQKTPVPPDPKDPKFAGFFHGRVAGPDGKPLRDARVYIVDARGKAKDAGTVRAKTDADGRFAFDAPDMTYAEYDGLPARREGLLIVAADGYAPDWFTTWGQATDYGLREYWTPRKDDKFDMQLAKDDVPIHGRFLDPDGKPLAGARVRVSAMMVPDNRDLSAHIARWSKTSVHAHFLSKVPSYMRELFRPELISGLTLETQTDADGRFKISGIGRDRIVRLKVSAPNVIDTSLEVMTRESPDVGTFLDGVGGKGKPTQTLHGAGFTMQLKPGRTIKGRVIDRETRKGVAGMWVGPLFYYGMSSELYPWVTDKNGEFTISGLDPATEKFTIMAFAAPGVPYQSSGVDVKGGSEAVIESRRGIPFRLNVLDEKGEPVEAEVTYAEVNPNPNFARPISDHTHLVWPNNPAARKTDGSYEGFVIPGPGAILVQTKKRLGFRSAQVDPKAFFAPGKTNFTDEEQKSAFGTLESIVTSSRGTLDQIDYVAIVLVNPPQDSGPLELSATVVKERPRQVTLIDSDDKPVEGVQMQFKLPNGSADGFLLRTGSFPLTGLHPDRVKRITFLKEDRKLIGLLVARGDGDTPYTVRMQKWGTVTGRIVDEDGRAYPISKASSDYKKPPIIDVNIDADPPIDDHYHSDTDTKGRFRVGKLVPGQTYNGQLFEYGSPAKQVLFEKLTLQPGEVRDLGDIRVKLNYEPSYIEPSEEDQKNTAKIPAEAWGEPVNGLRVAFALRSPYLYKNEMLGYDIVAENVSDHDIRFAVPVHPRYGIYKIQIVGADGKQVPQHEGALRNFSDQPRLNRYWLKPKQRMLISPCNTQLVKLDQAGKPTSLPERDPHFHSFNIKPGRYTLSATVKFAPTMEYNDEKGKIHKVEFGAKGEWTGELKTGAVAASLFEEATK